MYNETATRISNALAEAGFLYESRFTIGFDPDAPEHVETVDVHVLDVPGDLEIEVNGQLFSIICDLEIESSSEFQPWNAWTYCAGQSSDDLRVAMRQAGASSLPDYVPIVLGIERWGDFLSSFALDGEAGVSSSIIVELRGLAA